MKEGNINQKYKCHIFSKNPNMAISEINTTPK